MSIKKSELYSSIRKSCDELLGGIDALLYKDYVLILLFMRYVSDKYGRQKNPLIVIPKGGSFAYIFTAENALLNVSPPLKGFDWSGSGSNDLAAH